MEAATPQHALTRDDQEAIKILLARQPRDGVGPLTTYLLLAHGIGLATCFTTVGNGWANGQIVTIVGRLIPLLLLGIISAGFPLLKSREVADSIVRLEHSLDDNPSVIKEALKQSQTLFRLGQLASSVSVMLFLISIFYGWYGILTKNFATRSDLEFSPVSLTNHKMMFLVSNNGGVSGLITNVQLNFGLKNKNADGMEIDLPLVSGSPFFINPNEQKNLVIDMRDADSAIQQYITAISATNFIDELIQGSCSVDFFVEDRAISPDPLADTIVRTVNVNCWDVVAGLPLEPGSVIKNDYRGPGVSK